VVSVTTRTTGTDVRQFRLPDVGEGLTEAEVVAWRVAVGDVVEVNDVVVEIETAKSVVELPSPHAGRVVELHVPVGTTARVGDPLLSIAPLAGGAPENGDPGADTAGPATSGRTTGSGSTTGPAVDSAGVGRGPAVLVGYGPGGTDDPVRRRRRVPHGAAHHAVNGAADDAAAVRPPRPVARAKPPVRRLAKDLGVDLTRIAPSGPGGRVTREDVLRSLEGPRGPAQEGATGAVRAANGLPAPTAHSGDDGARAVTRDDGDERVPVRGVRKATAAAMTASAFTAPQVTEFLTVDATRSVALVDRLRRHPAFDGSRVTMSVLAARALVAAVREFPDANASWDEAAGEIVRHGRVHLGVATATPRGLLVPRVRDAGSLTLPALAAAMTEVTAAARDGRASVADLSGSTVTLTNIGVFGVDTGTPLLNPGEAVILCLGAVRRRPWEHRGAVALRSTVQLSMTLDHRIIDGEVGSRVLARVGRILEDPRTELLLV
jgi:pyruvate dehydrogenase E2 component (dihydrolipoamide acetyltransferase)